MVYYYYFVSLLCAYSVCDCAHAHACVLEPQCRCKSEQLWSQFSLSTFTWGQFRLLELCGKYLLSHAISPLIDSQGFVGTGTGMGKMD